jgi:hypothetical protein
MPILIWLLFCFQALEALLLRCPAEITPFLGAIVQTGNQYIKYDPVCLQLASSFYMLA